MDILRKDLNAIYDSQELDREVLDPSVVGETIARIKAYTEVNDCCCVITDASADVCYIIGGSFCKLLGITESSRMCQTVDSSDEDVIYSRLHPEDLVEKRMLEYEYFKYVDPMPGDDKVKYKAVSNIRVKDSNGNYITVANSTQVFRTSTAGKIWLILCCYDLSAYPAGDKGICPRIVNNSTGDVITIATENKRHNVLTDREKEVLQLIKEGKPSKQIANILGISIHTVSRHRQNIIEKLSVGSTVEAISAASLMKLM